MSLTAAYLAGCLTPFAAWLGLALGLRWWARLRRSEAAGSGDVPELPVTALRNPAPPPSSPQDVNVGRVHFGIKPSRVRHRRPGR